MNNKLIVILNPIYAHNQNSIHTPIFTQSFHKTEFGSTIFVKNSRTSTASNLFEDYAQNVRRARFFSIISSMIGKYSHPTSVVPPVAQINEMIVCV